MKIRLTPVKPVQEELVKEQKVQKINKEQKVQKIKQIKVQEVKPVVQEENITPKPKKRSYNKKTTE